MATKKKKNNTNNYSTKQDNVPADGDLRRTMIEQFIADNQDDNEMFEVIEVVPYDGEQMVRSRSKRGSGGDKNK